MPDEPRDNVHRRIHRLLDQVGLGGGGAAEEGAEALGQAVRVQGVVRVQLVQHLQQQPQRACQPTHGRYPCLLTRSHIIEQGQCNHVHAANFPKLHVSRGILAASQQDVTLNEALALCAARCVHNVVHVFNQLHAFGPSNICVPSNTTKA